ncbi:hypothetical protein SPLC1_S540950 [Arthrospira platensis C1]|nr:hypothetical protein SPLC1_S540950 [Arthrospira platensis C1]
MRFRGGAIAPKFGKQIGKCENSDREIGAHNQGNNQNPSPNSTFLTTGGWGE